MNLDWIIKIVGTISIVILAIIFIIAQVRRQDLNTLRESNKDLRDAIDDKSKEIETLQRNQSIMAGQILGLQQSVKQLEGKNSDMQQLIKDALVMYFQKNPAIAKVVEKM